VGGRGAASVRAALKRCVCDVDGGSMRAGMSSWAIILSIFAVGLGAAANVAAAPSPVVFALPAETYVAGHGPGAANVADFDQNGWLDICVVLNFDDAVAVLLNNADSSGTFQTPAILLPVGNVPFGAAVGDFDRNGAPDIATVSTTNNTLSVLLNMGKGVFAPQVVYGVGAKPYDVAAGALSADNAADLAVINHVDNTLQVLINKNDGTGSFLAPTTYATGNAPDRVVIHDVNGTTSSVVSRGVAAACCHSG
jgi:hypothetical protein